jgi:crotonobetainyl-CoA:carnitine CoA-transferase CaiB-like acyl-CoA transferase
MGGLAYMTGPPGTPLRAGASVIDVTGGMFGVIGILAALERRRRSGQGAYVKCSLFETTGFLVGQHMAQMAVTGKPAAPMPTRISAWAIYDVFETADTEQVFVAVVSDAQWRAFCAEFGLAQFAADPALASNNDRVRQRARILPAIRQLFALRSRNDLLDRLEAIGVPATRIGRPEDLFDDEHLNASGGLVDLTLPDGRTTRLPALPLELDGERFDKRRDLGSAGANSREVLAEIGLSGADVDALARAGVVG